MTVSLRIQVIVVTFRPLFVDSRLQVWIIYHTFKKLLLRLHGIPSIPRFMKLLKCRKNTQNRRHLRWSVATSTFLCKTRPKSTKFREFFSRAFVGPVGRTVSTISHRIRPLRMSRPWLVGRRLENERLQPAATRLCKSDFAFSREPVNSSDRTCVDCKNKRDMEKNHPFFRTGRFSRYLG